MTTSTITSKGQITLPAKFRKLLRIKPSDKVVFVRDGERVYMEKLGSLDSLFGSLANPKVKPLSAEEINKKVEEGMIDYKD